MALKLDVALLCLVLCSCLLTKLECNDCFVNDIEVQVDFDIEKYTSQRWYEVSWKRLYFDPPYDNYQDYVEVYDFHNTTHVSVLSSGRISTSDDVCVNNTFSYQVTSDPAKWKRIAKVDNVEYNVDYWVIRTDYDNYAFVYGCTLQNPNGTCKEAHAWKWGRQQTLQESYIRILNETATSLCMDNDDFEESRQNRDCLNDVNSPDISGDITHHCASVIMLTTYLALWMLLI